MTIEELHLSMTNIKPNEEQINRIENVRAVAKVLGETIHKNCPVSRPRSLAFTKLEESLMWAVKSIVLEGK